MSDGTRGGDAMMAAVAGAGTEVETEWNRREREHDERARRDEERKEEQHRTYLAEVEQNQKRNDRMLELYQQQTVEWERVAAALEQIAWKP